MSKRRNSRPRRGSLPAVLAFESKAPGGIEFVAYAPADRTLDPTRLVDATEARSAAKVGEDGQHMTVHYIRAGWSLNGRYYPANVLRTEGVKAATPGTLLYIDHATDDEEMARPSGSVTKLAAVQEGDAWWDEAAQAVAANVRLFRPWRESLVDMADTIGLSVRAWITAESGEADGRRGPIVQSIEGYKSVDFVTVPAAGGKIISVYEALADEARNTGAWLESRIHAEFTRLADRMYGEGFMSREERITLSGAIGDALAAFVIRVETDAPQLFTRDPFAEPGAAAAAEENGGTTAAAVQEGLNDMTQPSNTGSTAAETAPTAEAVAAEARAAVATAEADRLRAIADRATESDRRAAEAAARADAAEARARTLLGNEAARTEVGRQIDALTGIPSALLGLIRPRVESAVVGRVPFVAEGDSAGQVDATALTAAVTAAIESERTYAAQLLEANGVGAVTGLGGGAADESGPVGEAFEAEAADIFKRLGVPSDVAALAAKGR
jgi:hypothetical protein